MNRFAPKVTDDLRRTVAERVSPLDGRARKAREAAGFLFFTHGIYPSAAVVRECIGVGSLTDVNNDLRSFWDDLRHKGAVKISAPMLPEPVVELFGEALAKVWQLAIDKAQTSLDEERREAAGLVAQAQRESAEAQRMRVASDTSALALEAEIRQEREKRAVAEKRAETQAGEIEALHASLAQWQQQAETEAKARQEAEERFSRDLEAERAERKRDSDMFSGESRFAKMQIEAARSAERDLREQLKAEKSDKEVELAAYRQRAGRAEEALGTALLELAETKGQSRGLEDRLAEMQERFKELAKGGSKAMVRPAVKRRSLR